MAKTYEPIGSTVLSSTSNSITFTSIPNTYTDLKLILVVQTSSVVGGNLVINSDTNANYCRTSLNGNGSTPTSSSTTNGSNGTPLGSGNGIAITSNGAWTLIELDFMSYLNAPYKLILQRWSNDQNGSGQSIAQISTWRSTSAITSITFNITGMVVGTTATLYGIKAA